MDRRGFLGYLLGTGTTAIAAKLVEPTPAEVRAVQKGGYDFACLPKGGVYVKSVDLDIDHPKLDVTTWHNPAFKQHIALPPEIELTVVMRVLDPQRGMEIAQFFTDRMGQSL